MEDSATHLARRVLPEVPIRQWVLHHGAIVILQRFTNTLAVFPPLHVLVLDGVYEDRDDGAPPVFHARPPPIR